MSQHAPTASEVKMISVSSIMADTKEMIDDLKAVCVHYGLGGASSEYKIITEVFLYKFLNDKFLYELRAAVPDLAECKNLEKELEKMPDEDYELLLLSLPASTAKLKREHFLSNLYNQQNEEKFDVLFDNTLVGIAQDNIAVFSVQSGDASRIRLFDALSPFIVDQSKRPDFCRAIVNKLVAFSFEQVFAQKYDFFAAIFEYLIKDYNKDFGKYAEYYTPHSIATIIAKVLCPHGTRNVTVYDPAAGTGTLVLALAHQIGEQNCTIYTQDISQKSNELLRMNLILNNLVHSLNHAIQGDTLVSPRHLNRRKNGLMLFDYIVSNPPFNMDFSETQETLAGDNYKDRFWAGVPKVPNKKKEGMAIYQLFLQHIIVSLNEGGKAAVVVPTGFLTASSGIPLAIRYRLVEKRMLRGVISMPSNIFATTGTNVSIVFIDGENKDGDVILMDASKLGHKEKVDGKNQKTVLEQHEIAHIITTFNNADNVNDFCVATSYDQIKSKKYSFSAGQYFDVKIDRIDITHDEFTNKLVDFTSRLEHLLEESKKIDKEILMRIKQVKI